jgi:hypothetical protein
MGVRSPSLSSACCAALLGLTGELAAAAVFDAGLLVAVFFGALSM